MAAGVGTDARWMAEALALARRGVGRTRPNPPVGAVVVRRGRCVGRGWHRRAGGAHAEVAALRQAGAAARGATLYVTLEPCCTHGRTPPCTEAIRAAGIARVVVAVRDPNPCHAGRGLRLLRRAGIEVRCGVCGAEGRDLVRAFDCRVRRGRVWVTLKMAATLDGRLADAQGASRWLTGAPARARVDRWRREADAVLVGSGTVRADDPFLLPRTRDAGTTWRVVAAGPGGLPRDARVLRDAHAARTIVAAVAPAAAARRSWARNGACVWDLPGGPDGRVRLDALLERLAAFGLLHVLCEGGGTLAAALLRAGLADELLWFTAPLVLGADAVPAVRGGGWTLAAAPRWQIIEHERLGADLVLRARPAPAAPRREG